MRHPVLRVCRPSDDPEALLPFYREGLGFDVLCRFRDRQGFDGVMLGHPGAPYHLEFTRAAGRRAGRAPSLDHLLVFFVPDATAWSAAVARMRCAGSAPVQSFNSDRDRSGESSEDPDGYRVVIRQSTWTV
ncbi:VOC family protein [Rhizosaccharibacter radicis]|uniref:VOC family protein n=1 Tax=Rhizosaccharibacter radicis TaxID=2782605 RepID=A0ABT1VTP8_9PROT|nr:VOC family protein [Acetobacteraceae bacterium KSS12]